MCVVGLAGAKAFLILFLPAENGGSSREQSGNQIF